MNSLTITNVFCSSCALILFYVTAQTSCPSGWFGPRCQYKCQCTGNACDTKGTCTGSAKCLGGWFGPGCQYLDLAYLQADRAELSDGDDRTCNTNAGLSTTTILMNETTPFTWMRVQFKGPGQVALDKLQVTFFEDSSQVTCADPKFQAVTNWTLDMHCHLPREINKLILRGQTVASLCSVYVSGGRNVALKEEAQQDTVYSTDIDNVTHYFTANLSVDGNTSSSLYLLSCAHTKGSQYWRLKFSQPRLVHTYIVYNRMDNSEHRSVGLTLESFDNSNKSVFLYTDTGTVANATYRITHNTQLAVRRIIVTYYNREKILQMCELEVYGDSYCDNLHYGRDCELSCTCALRVPCYVNTGGCPAGCAVGYRGDSCETGCTAGKFGQFCNETCSAKCELPGVANTTYCNISSGECLQGCESGFKGDFCQDACDFGKYGKGCNSSCSARCVPTEDATTSCNKSSGACFKGCQSGFSGSFCEKECDAGKFGLNCDSTCSQNCAPINTTGASINTTDTSPCDHVTGSCHEGCQSGFMGSNCLEECPAGKFGLKCSVSCSQKCAPADIIGEPPCDPVTKVCLKGCQPGFSGPSCLVKSAVTPDSIILPVIVGACLLIAAIAFFGYCFCKKRTTRQSAEKKDASVHPELLH